MKKKPPSKYVLREDVVRLLHRESGLAYQDGCKCFVGSLNAKGAQFAQAGDLLYRLANEVRSGLKLKGAPEPEVDPGVASPPRHV